MSDNRILVGTFDTYLDKSTQVQLLFIYVIFKDESAANISK